MKTLHDIKLEVIDELTNGETQKYLGHASILNSAIDYIHSKGLLMVWQPIETAPKDGTDIIVNMPQVESGCTFVYWENGRWHLTYDGKPLLPHVKPPTAWMPLPRMEVTK